MLCAIGLALADLLAWLSGAVGALLLRFDWPHTSVGDALVVLPQLLMHPAAPAAAWPSAVQSAIPGALPYYGIALAVSAAAVWMVATARRPEGALLWAPPHPARRGFASRRDVRRRLDGRAARRAWTLLTPTDSPTEADRLPR